VFNYNENPEKVEMGVRHVVACVSSSHKSSDASCSKHSFMLRRALGHALVDYGQLISFSTSPEQQQQQQQHSPEQQQQLQQQQGPVPREDQTTQPMSFIVAPRESTASNVTNSGSRSNGGDICYEFPRSSPVGLLLRIVIHSNWGDPYYVGLDCIELITMDMSSSLSTPPSVCPLKIRPEQVCAAPSSVRCLRRGVEAQSGDDAARFENDKRIPSNLVPASLESRGARGAGGGWLTPLAVSLIDHQTGQKSPQYSPLSSQEALLPPSLENELYVMLDSPQAVAGFRVWNYSKSPNRGARDVSVYFDGKLLSRTTLSKHDHDPPKSLLQSTSPDPSAHQTVLFTSDPVVVAHELPPEKVGGKGKTGEEQHVICLDEGRVAVKAREDAGDADPSAVGVWAAQRAVLDFNRPMTSMSSSSSLSLAQNVTREPFEGSLHQPATITEHSSNVLPKPPMFKSASSSSSSSASSPRKTAPTTNTPMAAATARVVDALPAKCLVAQKKSKCRVLQLADASTPLGHPSFAASSVGCASMRCLSCDFQVLRVPHKAWRRSKVSYLYLRTHFDPKQHPSDGNLGSALEHMEGAAAYACQCSWRTVFSGGEGGSGIEKVTGTAQRASSCCSGDGKPLQWCCAGH
jgi:hypothetical protein